MRTNRDKKDDATKKIRADDGDNNTLGAEGVLPGRQIESLLRVCNQFAPTLPSR